MGSAGRGLGSALDTEGLADDQRGLLDLIDKLQFAQLDNIKLPQICVVGDQSAGKSSVLEAITGTPFPRDAGACTRFATEIRLRRAAETSLKVSIIPDKHRDLKAQEAFRSFGGRVDQNMSFEQLMRESVALIAPKNTPGRFAARDILVVEKRGPDLPLLTLVDLPGLVRNANNDQSIDDIKTIEALCDRYMKSSRTIVLAVVGGNSDYVQAPILTKARAFDPSGSRTIGVLTKPDLCDTIGLEDKFIDLVNNKDKANFFKLGWYVLLNPSPRESGQPWPTARERKLKEDEFFGRGKWRALPSEMCGAEALKAKLSVQLQRHIGRHVKTLRRQIQTALDETEAELKSMGEGRDTVDEMRIELVELFGASKELVIPAVYGFYKNPPGKKFFRMTADPRGTPAQNLRARAAEENDSFSHRIRQHGRKFGFTSSEGDHGEVSNTETQKQNYIRQEVTLLLNQIRGSEFPGDAKPRAVYMLFQSYSEYWPKLAQEHKDNLGVVCNEFLSELIRYAWPKRMHEPLRREFLEPQMRALMDKAQRELDLLTNDMHLEVQPYDPEYEEKLRRWQRSALSDGQAFSEAEEVLEKMLIFYDLQAKSFIRNVIMQVVERHLLLGMYGIFESVKCLSMTDESIELIAAENKETRERRVLLNQRKRAIEDAKETCAQLSMRKELRMYANEAASADEETSDDDDSKPSLAPSARPNASAAAPRSRRREALQPSAPATAPIPPRANTAQYQPPAAAAAQADEEGQYAPQRFSPPRGPAPAVPSAAPPIPPPRPEKVNVQVPQQQYDDGSGYYREAQGYENGIGRPSLEEHPSYTSQSSQSARDPRRGPGRIGKILGRG